MFQRQDRTPLGRGGQATRGTRQPALADQSLAGACGSAAQRV